MRSLGYDNIKAFAKLYPQILKIRVFVETGTYKGGTIFPMSKHFKELHTVEICKKAHLFCKNHANVKGIKNIKFYLGDSLVVLPKIIDAASKEARIYFLDGHVTDNGSGYTGKGKLDVPLLQELKAINDKDPHPSVIIIDDIRLLGSTDAELCANADWSGITLEKIKAQFDPKRINMEFKDPNYRAVPINDMGKPHENDRYIIVLNAKKC